MINIDYTTIAATYAASSDRSFRATVRSTIERDLSAAITDATKSGDWSMVQTINTVKTTINEPTVVPTDHTATYVARITALRVAADVLAMHATANDCDVDVASTIDPDLVARIFDAMVDGTTDDLDETARGIAKLVRVPRSTTRNATYTGPRRSVPAHIESAFADLNTGDFLKIRDIARHTSDTYGDDHPTDGAVGAALFTKDGVPRTIGNIVGVIRDGRRGATIVD